MCKTFADYAAGQHCAPGNKVPTSACQEFLKMKTGDHSTTSTGGTRRRVSRRRLSYGDDATTRCWGTPELVSYNKGGHAYDKVPLWTICREECWRAMKWNGSNRRRGAQALKDSPGCKQTDCTNLQSAIAATLI